eukprot:1389190-Pyramimonas_sp.AAC.1
MATDRTMSVLAIRHHTLVALATRSLAPCSNARHRFRDTFFPRVSQGPEARLLLLARTVSTVVGSVCTALAFTRDPEATTDDERTV